MSTRYRKAQRIIKTRRFYAQVASRWLKYGCSCGYHNMRGDR